LGAALQPKARAASRFVAHGRLTKPERIERYD
jgi:hypothetical protein